MQQVHIFIYLTFKTTNMKKLFILLLLCGFVIISRAQNITIIDQESEKPLEFVDLVSENPKLSTFTNTNGQADISEFKGLEKIQISMVGYITVWKSYEELSDLDFKLKLKPSVIKIDEVVIAATRWKQLSNRVPSKISSITYQDMEFLNPQTQADLLGTSGQVFIQKSQQAGGSPMIRGFATNRLFYAVDGVRMNTAIFRSGNIQNVINLDPFSTEKTEVLFGPGSVIYGSDAIGGVMNFQSLNPELSLSDKPLVGGMATARYSSANNEATGHLDVNVGWKKWAFVTSFSSWDFDNLQQGSNGPDDYIKPYYVQRQDGNDVVITQDNPLLQIPTAYSQMNLLQKVRFSPNKKWDFTYGFYYSEISTYGRYDRHNRVKKGLPRYAEWNYGPQKWMMNLLTVTNKANNKVYDQMSIRLAQQSFEESRISRSLNNVDRTTNLEEVIAYSLNLDFTKSINSKNTLFYGFEYVLDDVTSTGTITDIVTDSSCTGPARYPNSTWTSIAAYLNDEFVLSEKVSLQAGLRYNYFILDADFSNNLDFYPFPFSTANINDGALTGSIGAVWSPAKTWIIKTNLGTGFRSPNVDDIGKVFDSEPGSVVVPNPNLKPEYAYNIDLGFAKFFGDVLKIELTGFYTILDNAMVRRDYQLNGQDSIYYDGELSRVQAIQNAAKATVYGVQGSIELKLPAGFSFTSDLSYQKGEEELDDGSTSPLRHAAPLFGNSRLNFNTSGLMIQFYANYQGEISAANMPEEEKSKDEIYAKDADGNNYAPAWYTLNIMAMYDITKTFTINVGIENLTDQRYRPYSSGISAPGRNFILSLRCNF